MLKIVNKDFKDEIDDIKVVLERFLSNPNEEDLNKANLLIDAVQQCLNIRTLERKSSPEFHGE